MPDANGNPTPDDMMGSTAAPQLNPDVQRMIQALQSGAPAAPYGLPAPQAPPQTDLGMTPAAGQNQAMIPGGLNSVMNQMGQPGLQAGAGASPSFLNALQGPPDAGY